MKTFILALDGCDYNRVEQWELNNLKQIQHGNFISIINRKIGVPISPQVWSSFITGKVQNIDSWRKYKYGINIIKNYIPKTWLKTNLFKIIKKRNEKNKIYSYVNRTDIKGKTLFEVINKSISINIPVWNNEASKYPDQIVDNLNNIDLWDKNMYKNFYNFYNQLNNSIKMEWDLIMAHTPILDAFGHIYTNSNITKLCEAYIRTDLLVKKIKENIDEDLMFIIISDHGMKNNGIHSNESFYSFNKYVNFQPKQIIDFYDFIINIIKNQK